MNQNGQFSDLQLSSLSPSPLFKVISFLNPDVRDCNFSWLTQPRKSYIKKTISNNTYT